MEENHILRTSGLVRSFGRRAVIKGLDLNVPAGDIYGFLGRNGAGKTTTIRMLLGVLQPDGGTIEFEGQVKKRTSAIQRRRIGTVSQQQHFYPWMSARALGRFVGGFYPSWSKEIYAEQLKRLGVETGQPCGQMSGGTKMKLAFALAMAPDPPLLILDVPTAGVDPVARRELLDAMQDAADRGKTVFFSSHHIEEMEELAQHIGVLVDGQMVYEGPKEGLGPDLEAAFLHLARSD